MDTKNDKKICNNCKSELTKTPAETSGTKNFGDKYLCYSCYNAGWRFNQYTGSMYRSNGKVDDLEESLKMNEMTKMKVEIKEQIAIDFVLIPSGTFIMGSPENETGRHKNEKQHEVIISKSFYMQDTPVTRTQWTAIMGDNPSYFKDGDYPAENVSWKDTQIFIEKLNDFTKKTFRLPTEAEWEYACRAGTKTSFNVGDSLENKANYNLFFDKTTVVKSFPPNNWWLYDMHGNVWEWVEDDWHDNYTDAPEDGSAWVDSPRCAYRVNRGGGWYSIARRCRSASRDWSWLGIRDFRYGFRLALSF